MSALNKILVTKHTFVAEGLAWTLPAEAAVETKTHAGTHLKNVALFLAAPFVGLAYLLTFPLVGLAMLLWVAGKKLAANKTARPILFAVTAPIATIALVTVAPVIGLGALVWVGGRARMKN